VSTPPAARLPGPDVVRAVALIGVVVMNYHGYLLIEAGAGTPGDGWAAALFDPWQGPLGTRFAATFVLVAGVGVTLMTASSIGDPDRTRAMRWRLVRRGLLLYAGGLALDEIWPGTILPYYGAMFALGALMFTWRARWVVIAGGAAALAAWALRAWRYEQAVRGRSTAWLDSPDEWSPADLVFGLTVNGTHPLLPWLAFFCAGIVLGRVLRTTWWRPAAVAVGFTLVTVAALAATTAVTDRQLVLLSTRPFERGVMYTASALGTALLAYALVDWVAGRFPVATDPLRRAGQMTLTLYLAHVVVFEFLVVWTGWVEPAGLDLALVLAFGFWVIGVAAAVAWNRRYGIGPAERLYRWLGG
jgi:uncharacterized membrane protein YeiB